MTDQELIRALRCCVSSPRLDKCREECVFCKGHDMANCIPQMGQAVADRLSSLVEDLERVTRERDAAVEAVRGDCTYCTNDGNIRDNSPCWHCKHYAAQCYITGDYWQWRGPKEAET